MTIEERCQFIFYSILIYMVLISRGGNGMKKLCGNISVQLPRKIIIFDIEIFVKIYFP